MSFGVPNGCRIEGIRESFLELLSGTLDFYFISTIIIQNSTCFRSEGTNNLFNFDVFFEAGFWQALGDRFLQSLIDVRVPRECQLARKWGLKTRSEKHMKKGARRQCEEHPMGSLK